MRALAAGLCGAVFGAGLELSGMTNPAKVLAFLDVFGAWDPTLAVVMGTALATNAVGTRLVLGRGRPLLGGAFAIPTRRDLDARLLTGAALFGAGWGLVGLCPGPALANLSRPSGDVFLFVAALLAGVAIHRFATRERQAGGEAAPAA